MISRNAVPNTSGSLHFRSHQGSPTNAPSSSGSSIDAKAEEESFASENSSTLTEKLIYPPIEISQAQVRESSTTISTGMSSQSSRRPSSDSVSMSENLTSSFGTVIKDEPATLRLNVPVDDAITSKVDYENTIRHMNADYEAAELRRQEETHQYLERIDALQAKLQYLTREAMEAAKSAEHNSETGTTTEKLAQKDEKIALLMQEGNKLSQNEMKLLTNIKKLRAKSLEDEKRLALSRQASEKAEKAKSALYEQIKQNESCQMDERDMLRKAEKDLERVKGELSFKASKLSELQNQVSDQNASRQLDDSNKHKELLTIEKKSTLSLMENLSTLNIEKNLADHRHRAQIKELQENADRERERHRISDSELRGELGVRMKP